jgi:hypothetical protein
MVVVAGPFLGDPSPRLVAANEGVLLHYVNAEDHGWALGVWYGAREVCAYRAEWTEDIVVDDGGLDLDALHASLTPVPPANWAAIDAQLTSTPDDAAIISPGGNPGHRVAALLGLARVEWMSGAAMAHDPDLAGTPGVVAVEGEEVGVPPIAEIMEQMEQFERRHGRTGPDGPPDSPPDEPPEPPR